MGFRGRVVAIVSCLVLLLSSLPSFPYGIGDEAVTAKVDFPFTAGDKQLPPGTYRFTHRVSEFPEIEVGTVDGKALVPILAVTRLARRGGGEATQGNLVFDKIGDKYYLAEVWLPALDGFLLRATKEKHEHVVVSTGR